MISSSKLHEIASDVIIAYIGDKYSKLGKDRYEEVMADMDTFADWFYETGVYMIMPGYDSKLPFYEHITDELDLFVIFDSIEFAITNKIEKSDDEDDDDHLYNDDDEDKEDSV